MQPYEVIEGDALAVMRGMPDNSVDAVCTDPPYGLSKEPNIVEVLTHWINGDDYQHRGGGFMGKSWDAFVPGPAVWREVFRVMKPGAHALVFGGTRTVDLTVIALRMAGFEIRDSLAWMYGSGMPKSLDVSKQFDKVAGAEREVVGRKPKMGGVVHRPNGTGWDRPWQHEPDAIDKKLNVTAPATDLAKQWDGWGTALKPAYEPIVLARKPLTGTVAANVAQWGTGALNVAGCRIPTNGETITAGHADSIRRGNFQEHEGWDRPWKADTEEHARRREAALERANTQGRWPANVILDEEAAAALDRMSGTSKSRPNTYGATTERSASEGYGVSTWNKSGPNYADAGGASRFFYCAKSSRAERNAGLEGMPERAAKSTGWSGLSMPLRQDGTERKEPVKQNVHPTVKPIALMRYLCRLITPPGGLILDPFAGSGSTGCAAVLEGFRFVGVDADADYCDIARARIAHWAAQRPEAQQLALTGD